MTDLTWRSDEWGDLNARPDAEVARHSRLICEEAQIPEFVLARRFVLQTLRLREGATLVELGVGPAPYAELTMPLLGRSGTWIGIDTTAGFVLDAEQRAKRVGGCGTIFQCADARDVPLSSGSADAVIADKLLIHVSPVSNVVQEMVRLARPGAWIASCDAESDALFVHASDLTLTRRILRHCAEVRATPNAASLAAEEFTRAGLREVQRRGFIAVMSDISTPFVPHIVNHWAARAVGGGAITDKEAAVWVNDVLGKAKAGSALVCFPLLVTWGRKRSVEEQEPEDVQNNFDRSVC